MLWSSATLLTLGVFHISGGDTGVAPHHQDALLPANSFSLTSSRQATGSSSDQSSSSFSLASWIRNRAFASLKFEHDKQQSRISPAADYPANRPPDNGSDLRPPPLSPAITNTTSTTSTAAISASTADTMVGRSHKPAAISADAAKTGPQPVVEISSDSSRVSARLSSGESIEVLLHGATVLSWKSNGGRRENLWLSEAAVLDGSKPVRGGIPIVFPAFGPPPKDHATSALSQHGFARASRWEYLGKSTSESSGDAAAAGGPAVGGSGADAGDSDSVKLDFGLYPSALAPEVRKAWPFEFGLVYSITLSRDSLQTMLYVQNDGDKSFDFQALLHTYLKVEEISTTTVTGLLGTTYVDKVLNGARATESASELRIAGEVDRVYEAIAQPSTNVLERGKPRFEIVRDNLSDTVIWNPAAAKAAAFPDLAPADGWKSMLCVEVGAVRDWQRLEPGDRFEAGQIIRALE